ncbi:MAG: two-component sensor histidine kinase [Variovorax sp.]|nr:two-component sensor histidine kinase [Variovorax sp.]
MLVLVWQEAGADEASDRPSATVDLEALVRDPIIAAPPQAGARQIDGLGLAIVRTIAERHGAAVRLGRSERLGGLQVELRFPLR